jgi:vancomycin resistance protein VanJ
MDTKPPKAQFVCRWLRWFAVALGVGYPLALLIVWLVLRLVGESWWVSLVGLYAPPVGFLFPAPLVIAVAWAWAPRRILLLQAVSLLLAVFPLMGLHLGSLRTGSATDASAIRLVSYNIDVGFRGVPGIVAQVQKLNPNLVLLQEAEKDLAAELTAAFAGWHTDFRGQFFVASRFPMTNVYEPPPIHYQAGEAGSPREGDGGAHFVVYTIATPLGLVDVFNVHTTSPREGLEDMRGQGFLYELRAGHVLLGQGRDRLMFNAYRRARQAQGLAATAQASAHPVIIAGDTNLPGLSRIFHENLGGFDDAFAAVGRGFGYSYPAKLPWLRIDRILTNGKLRAVDFRIGDTLASDHLCVSATLTAGR